MRAGKNNIWIPLLLALTFTGMRLHAQTPATKGLDVQKTDEQQAVGKTYALIVGISKYQYPECYPTLNYADVDARTFFNYMTSKTGGNVDPSNIDTLFNARATKEDFWGKFNSIKNRLQKNDNFYIYFSGHGDAISSDLAYLLTYNAPPGNDKNNYFTTSGVVDIHTLKSLIKMITLDKNKPAHVILITDACRSNEMPPGKEEGRQQFYDEMYTKNAGEVQLVSCLANQVSFEDAKWGGGRGLFSWHLVNGMMGMADNKPEDDVVTLKELITYVSDKVQEDSYDKATKKYKQTPDYCCRDKDDVIMAKVDKPTKDKLAAFLKNGTGAQTEMPSYASSKGVNLGAEMDKEGAGDLYKQFRAAIDDNRLIEPAGDNAMAILQKILASKIKPELKSDLKFELSSRLMNDVTVVMNTYLHAATNNNNYTFNYFNTAARKLRAFQSISDTLYYNQVDVTVNRLFLEGHSKWLSTKTYELRECLSKVDSAVALKPQASFLYNLKGLMHMSLKQYKEAEVTLRKGIYLAPNWLYPYHNLASTYMSLGKYDSSRTYFFKALALDSNYQTTYGGIGVLYSYMGKADSERYYYKKGLLKDPTDPNLWLNLGRTYLWKKDWENALRCFYQGIHFDSTKYNSYQGALQVYLEKNDNTDSVKYYKNKMISVDPTNPQVYATLGLLYYNKSYYTVALEMYERAIEIDSMNAETWLAAGLSYEKLSRFESAENCMLHAASIDPAANNDNIYSALGLFYFYRNAYDKSLAAYGRAIRINPNIASYYYCYAFVSVENKDVKNAEKYYRETIKIDAKYYSAYFELAKIIASQSKTSEAIKMLEMAVKYGDYKRKDIENESAFAAMKESKEFKALLLKMKE